MFSHFSTSLTYIATTTSSNLLLLRPLPSSLLSLRKKFHLYPSKLFNLRPQPPPPPPPPRTSPAVTNSSVDLVTDGLKKQSLNEDKSVKLVLEDLNWDHSFVRELPGDPRTDVMPRQKMLNPRHLEVWRLGTMKYLDALKLQEKLASERKVNKISDTLLSLQHPPTYTLGKRRTDYNLLIPESEIKTMGAELHYTQRGGDITFHGPHQAILYPIVSLREIGLGARNYVEKLESTMVDLASLYGVKARSGGKCTGVWVEDRKIGAIGVRISSGITSHGLAFNIDPDLSYFKHIVPCGIKNKDVTSLRRETEAILPDEEVIQDQLINCFAGLFGYMNIIWKDGAPTLLDSMESE